MGSGHGWPYYSRGSGISRRNIRYSVFGRGRGVVGYLPLLREASLLLP